MEQRKRQTTKISNLSLSDNQKGSTLCTLGIGGILKQLYRVDSIDALQALIKHFRESNQSWKVLGAGSNILIPDDGVEQPVVKFGNAFSKFSLSKQDIDSLDSKLFEPEDLSLGERVCLLAYAATPLMSLSRKLSLLGYSGLEFAAGIPASLGGAVWMNAGAHGSAMSDVVKRVFVVNRNGDLVSVEHGEDLEFAYRKTNLEKDSLVVAAVLELEKGELGEIQNQRARCLEYRKKTQPLHLPSAGSTFRNPSDVAAALLIEEAGLKGLKEGGVSISKMHSNWVVRDEEDASSRDVLGLIRLVKEKVAESSGIELDLELVSW